jgi:vancomycin resistance protein VanJ
VAARGARSAGIRRLLTGACWVNAAALLVAWLVIRFGGDRWWFATVLMFGPRWVYAVPLVIAGVAATILRQRRVILPLSLAFVAVWALLDISIPWSRLRPTAGESLRILTCNVDGENVNKFALADLIFETQPDIVVLQEWPAGEKPTVTWPSGYHFFIEHGLLLASRFPLQIVDQLSDDKLGGPGAVVVADIEFHGKVIHFIGLHLSTPREGIEPLMDRESDGIESMRKSIARRAAESKMVSSIANMTGAPILIAGDMNMPCGSAIFRQFWSGYSDAFSTAGWGTGNSKFTRWWGIRIDHILADPGWKWTDCWVGRDIGSDHRPVIADVQ